MKVVLDTNVLLPSIAKANKLRPIWDAYLNEKYVLVLSNSVILEYEEKLAEKTSHEVALNVVLLLCEAVNSIFTEIHYEWNAITVDADDNKFFDTAIAGNADYLVTNDLHFNEAKNIRFPRIMIISAEEFLNKLPSLIV